MSAPILFEDRRDAGQQLAQQLAVYREEATTVLGLPRGGVPVAYEIAQALGAPLDVLVARKIGAPGQPEFGIGAVAPGGITLLDTNAMQALNLSDTDIAPVVCQEREEMERRLYRYRGKGQPDVKGRTVILVDDGLATGVTATAAIHAVRRLGARQVVLAVPICAVDTASLLGDYVDALICVSSPEPFYSVSHWYRDFSQTTDAEVIELLEEARGHITQKEIIEP